jgi:hypothetical protein
MIQKKIIETVLLDVSNVFFNEYDFFSKTRDVFTARVQSYIIETKKYLESAIIGEIGNNTFDHNFVFEKDYPRGVYCNTAYKQKYTVIADFGRGVRQSLLRVVPSISSDLEAVQTAFTKRISGRSPEQRGNGLKFVADTIQQNNWDLYFQSGTGCCSIDTTGMNFFETNIAIRGCLIIIDFNGGTR